jgi:hypothetical protein
VSAPSFIYAVKSVLLHTLHGLNINNLPPGRAALEIASTILNLDIAENRGGKGDF